MDRGAMTNHSIGIHLLVVRGLVRAMDLPNLPLSKTLRPDRDPWSAEPCPSSLNQHPLDPLPPRSELPMSRSVRFHLRLNTLSRIPNRPFVDIMSRRGRRVRSRWSVVIRRLSVCQSAVTRSMSRHPHPIR